MRLKRQKQDAYNRFIKEMNPPKVSPRKNGELLTNIQRIKHPVRERKDKYDNYLSELKLQHDHSREEESSPHFGGGGAKPKKPALRLHSIEPLDHNSASAKVSPRDDHS